MTVPTPGIPATAGRIVARATSDAADRLVAADEPLAGLQRRCGGELPGVIAVPGLLDLVRKARVFSLRLAQPIAAQDGTEAITAWVEVGPREDGAVDIGGCSIVVRSWQSTPTSRESDFAEADRRRRIDQTLSEFTAQLDASQCILTACAEAGDLVGLASAIGENPGQPWTAFVTHAGGEPQAPMHWRLLDGAAVAVAGSRREWRAHLHPRFVDGDRIVGFELMLTSDEPLAASPLASPHPAAKPERGVPGLIGREIAPVLRQPIARIIANAETIRARLAGPLADEYAGYAGDIAAAGEHLLTLIEDLADLEVVEAADFTTAPDPVDLADIARRAAGILGVRARERDITIHAPPPGEMLLAVAEFRRVLQVLLNLVGNAIRYSPAGSEVSLTLEASADGGKACVVVADQGHGLSAEQQARVFDKFERLERSGDGGSGLGLYISRRLARAMGGDLRVASATGAGARFILEVPAN